MNNGRHSICQAILKSRTLFGRNAIFAVSFRNHGIALLVCTTWANCCHPNRELRVNFRSTAMDCVCVCVCVRALDVCTNTNRRHHFGVEERKKSVWFFRLSRKTASDPSSRNFHRILQTNHVPHTFVSLVATHCHLCLAHNKTKCKLSFRIQTIAQ